ncbi:Cytidylate kinase [Candidatus Arsenophonus lipoptenae]|uniref:Cytidylate kinase n=1 Tax=Candidatus Arsenophonus lipoptenae TaxID=634113 RepID=A0A0X9WB46_9GAMM|nr:(d)CMP kinase [Candidatus Arsenophonus lipoptenae]AMA65123.1 Cytidylate kinase [Candidatus Arsenophonus lipoptenae]
MNKLPPVITVDGPSGSGKGTLCLALANKFSWQLLNSGAIYRVIALAVLQYNIDIKSEKKLVLLADSLNIRFNLIKNKLIVMLEGNDISNDILSEVIGNIASLIAKYPKVRKALLIKQRLFRIKPGLIADGRDMGTIVFPDAIAKIFLHASLKERALRRMKQLHKNGFNVKLSTIIDDIKKRDDCDRNRLFAPLIPAKNAFILDSTSLSFEKVIEQVLAYINKKI